MSQELDMRCKVFNAKLYEVFEVFLSFSVPLFVRNETSSPLRRSLGACREAPDAIEREGELGPRSHYERDWGNALLLVIGTLRRGD